LEKKYSTKNGDWVLTNTKTGEIADIDITVRRGGSRFMKLWQDGSKMLLERASGLHGQSYRVLCYLGAVARWGNAIPTPPEVAIALELTSTNVYRAYAELIEADIVIKREHDYFLSPYYCWKGNDVQYQQACRDLLSTPGTPMKQLSSSS
jgi:hypothetical protein